MKTLFCIAALLATINCFSQTDRKLSAFIAFNVNSTLYDRTLSNNGIGFGAGFQLYLRTKTWCRPALDFTSDIFGGTKELRITPEGKPILAKDGVTNVFAGIYFKVAKSWFALATAGPSIINDKAYLGIKPCIGYYLLKGRQLAFKTSFTNVFQRDDISNESFGYWNFSLAVKLF